MFFMAIGQWSRSWPTGHLLIITALRAGLSEYFINKLSLYWLETLDKCSSRVLLCSSIIIPELNSSASDSDGRA